MLDVCFTKGQQISTKKLKSSFQKDFLKFHFAPKNKQKYFGISALVYKKRSNQKISVKEIWNKVLQLVVKSAPIFLIWPFFRG